MRHWIGGFALLMAAASMLSSAGCGDDDDGGPPCREQCGPKKPFCGPNGSCVECYEDFDCGGGQHCSKDYECKS